MNNANAAGDIKPAVIFITGLSGSGKTSLAKAVIGILKQKGIEPVLLDGDEIRDIIKLVGFDEASRKKHNLYVGYMASLLEAQGKLVFVCLISPYEDIRQRVRAMCKRFFEVYLDTGLEVCIKRDPKGLYLKALKGEIKDFTGISSPYFPPSHPELVLDTGVLGIDECARRVLELLTK